MRPNRGRSLFDISSREQSWPLSHLITLARAFFVSRSACLSDSLFPRTIRSNVPGSVLIREEMALVIMSTLVNEDDNEQYYFYAMFCVGGPRNFQFPLNRRNGLALVWKHTHVKASYVSRLKEGC